MKLSECTIGKLVYLRDFYKDSPNFDGPTIYNHVTFEKDGSTIKESRKYLLVGHIIGLDLNAHGETTIRVLWNDGLGHGYSTGPGNLIEVKE